MGKGEFDYMNLIQKDGYSIINIQEKEILEQLVIAIKDGVRPEGGRFLYASNHQGSLEYNQQVDQVIEQAIRPLLASVFLDYHYLTGHFMIKPPCKDGEFQLHQDWSITQEQTYPVIHLWIPLEDTSPQNGGMFVIKGSHQYFDNYRSGSLDIPRIQRDKKVNRMITPLFVKKGQMLVYHPALFHGSFPNLGKDNREVILINLLHKAAPLLYFHKGKNAMLEIYTLSKRALLGDLQLMIKGGVPEDSVLLEVRQLSQHENARITSMDIYRHYIKYNEFFMKSFFQRFMKLVKSGY